MQFTSSSECCDTQAKGNYELCGCVSGVSYVQLTVVSATGHNTIWLNTETGETFDAKPVGFVTGTCQEAALNDTFKISATPPTATSPFAVPKDGDTVVYSDDLSPDNVLAYYRYEADTATWVEIPIVPAGGTEGFVLTKQADGSNVWAAPATQAILDNQVLTGGTGTNTTVTMTPVTVTDESGGTQVNYTVTATAKIDGATIVEDPTTKVLSVVFPAAFKEANRWYVDPNGADTNTGANEAPKLTAQAAVDALTANDTAVLNEGTYAAVTMSVQNTALVGASSTYGSLSQIAAVTVATASGTSNKISDLTITGNLARTGNAPLYVNNTTVGGNVTLAGTAYVEIRDSSIQDGSITQSGASILYIEDSKLGSSTFNTAGAVVSLRNVCIDTGKVVTIGSGVYYSLQDVVGNVVINAGAISVDAAVRAQGGTADQAEAAVTSHFMQIRMHTPDTGGTPTKMVTWNEATGELEVSAIPSVPTHKTLTVLATASQVSQTLPHTPVGTVIVTRNGVDISDAWTWVGAVGTYSQLVNYDCTIDENDKLKFHYEAV